MGAGRVKREEFRNPLHQIVFVIQFLKRFGLGAGGMASKRLRLKWGEYTERENARGEMVDIM
jgi:hypothetical protein